MTDFERQLAWDNELLKERLAELELAQEDAGWSRLGEDDREFSREGLRAICRQARLFWLKNPLVKRGVEVQAHYVYGQGVTIRSEDEAVNEVIQAFLDDAKNRAELTSHQAMLTKETELSVFGNLFFVFFIGQDGRVRVRSIPVDEIEEVISDPEDAKSAWLYLRVWTQRAPDGKISNHRAYYPDWHNRTRQGGDFGKLSLGEGVRWETPVFHVAVNRLSDMRLGVPEVYATLDWAKAYKEFLEDWATLSRAYSRFAHKLTLPAGSTKATVAAAKAKFGTTYNTASGETNPAPIAGSTFIAGNGVGFDPIRIGGANISAEDGRRLLLMVASAAGLPETFYGDASVGTVATATSLDRPTELKMRNRQMLWADAWQQIMAYVIEQAVRAGRLSGSIEEDDDGTPAVDVGDEAGVHVDFAPLLEHDVAATVQAITAAAGASAAGGLVDAETLSRLLLQALGVADVDAALDAIYPEGGESLPEQMARQKAEQQQAQLDAMKQKQASSASTGSADEDADDAASADEDEKRPVAEALMVEAVGELREAVAAFVRRHADAS